MVIVGSTNTIKLTAVKEALTALNLAMPITGVKAVSGIDEQPLGEITLKGAEQRARHARELAPDADLYIAIENGIFREGEVFVDRAVVVVLSHQGSTTTLSQGVVFPTRFVAQSVASNLTKTAGKYMNEVGLIRRHDDPHQDLDLIEEPGTRKPRAQILKETIIKALNPT